MFSGLLISLLARLSASLWSSSDWENPLYSGETQLLSTLLSSYSGLASSVKIFVNGAWIGVSDDPYKLFKAFQDNKHKLVKRNKSCGFRCARLTFYIPFKILVVALLI